MGTWFLFAHQSVCNAYTRGSETWLTHARTRFRLRFLLTERFKDLLQSVVRYRILSLQSGILRFFEIQRPGIFKMAIDMQQCCCCVQISVHSFHSIRSEWIEYLHLGANSRNNLQPSKGGAAVGHEIPFLHENSAHSSYTVELCHT